MSLSSDISVDSYDGPELLIQPRRGWIGLDWREMYNYRELLFFLSWRDIKVRYKQTVLGAAWAVLQPLLQMALFTIFFGRLANFKDKLPSGLDYSVWVYSGLLPWMLISSAMTNGGMSLVGSQNLLTKVYLPRLFVPMASVLSAVVDFAVSAVMFAILLLTHRASWHYLNPLGLLLLPVLFLMTLLIAMGWSFMLAALTVTYRDFRFVIQFLAQIVMYVSLVMVPFKAGELSYKRQLILSINPVYGMLQGYRTALFGLEWHPACIALSSVLTIGLFVFGLFYFRKTERRFADIA